VDIVIPVKGFPNTSAAFIASNGVVWNINERKLQGIIK